MKDFHILLECQTFTQRSQLPFLMQTTDTTRENIILLVITLNQQPCTLKTWQFAIQFPSAHAMTLLYSLKNLGGSDQADRIHDHVHTCIEVKRLICFSDSRSLYRLCDILHLYNIAIHLETYSFSVS